MPRVYRKYSVPPITSRVIEQEHFNFIEGINTYATDDNVKNNQLKLVQDGRVTKLGSYKTRQGADFYSDAAGVTQDQAQTSTTGAADKTFNTTTWLAQKFTAGTTGRLTKVEVRLKNALSATGTVLVSIYSDSSGPLTELAKSSIASSDITSSYAYLTARFISAPQVASGTSYWIVLRVQENGNNSYNWSSTTSATTADTSSDSGTSWSTTSYALNFKQYVSTDSPTLGLYRAYKSSGTKETLLAHGTVLYKVNDVTGALTSVKTGLSSSATKYRFEVANDVVYYVNGVDAPRKYDFSTDSATGGSPEVSTNLKLHKGLMFYVSASDPNKLFYSNFGVYETFTSTDFIEVPAPKTGDPIVALAPLNDALVIWTRYNKYILYGSDNATFQLTQAPGKKGTYAQETVAVEGNFAYFLGDEGLYRFNGTDDELISDAVYEDIKGLPNRDSACVATNNDRVYVFYRPSGEVANSHAFIYNLNLGKAESFDTNTYFNRGMTLFKDSGEFVVASSVVGQCFYLEKSTNDYTNLGGDIQFEIRTKYDSYGMPSRNKEVRRLIPRFYAQSGDYTVECQYAVDLRDNASTIPNGSVSMQGVGATFGDGTEFGDGTTFGSSSYVEANLTIPGSHRYIQRRYKHHATRQPVEFFGDYVKVQVRRVR